MIIKATIKKFRGFEDVELNLGSQLTIIAGKNGTQKSTVLGILTQPFTISAPDNPMKNEKPLCGGSFKSAFKEKFKLSNKFDKPKSHEWTLNLKNESKPFVVESIARGKEEVRFWRKGDRGKDSGYYQLPVIFLSLKRLIPIGEDEKLTENKLVKLTKEEENFFKEWHAKILISFDQIKSADYLESPNKNTLGITTDIYDWRQNSSGQDNISKILLAILSFKRLKEKYPQLYKGGILAIDEVDSTLYPGSQIKLLEALRKFSSKFNIQIILTTHSTSILEAACDIQEKNNKIDSIKDQVRVIFLEKKNDKIKVIQDTTISTIRHRLNETISGVVQSKINTFTEDKEAAIFVKAILKNYSTKLKFIDCTLSCSSLIDLSSRKIPSFSFPNSIIFLDGDVRNGSGVMAKLKKIKNIVVLPLFRSPERLIAEFLYNLDDESQIWQSINPNFTKSYCFKDYSILEIETDRQKAKDWFNSHIKIWGRNGSKIFNPWIKANKTEVNKFIEEFTNIYNTFAREFAIKEIPK